MVKCQNCGEEVGDSLICNVCGATVEKPAENTPKKFCIHCGAEMSNDSLVCGRCGKTENQTPNTITTNRLGNNLIATFNPGTGFLLSLFIMGGGHIYLGLFKRGISFLVIGILIGIIFYGILNLILSIMLGPIGYMIASILGSIVFLIVYVLSIYDVYEVIKRIINGENVKDDIAFRKLL